MVAPSPDTVADYLNCGVAPYLHSALISPEALAHIKQLAEMLPAALTSFFGFECLLGAREGVADFLVCASADDTGRDTLSGKLDGHRIPAAFGSSSDWRRVQQFAALWNDPSSPVFERVHNIWLEFDIDGPQHDVPQPSVFLGTNFLRAELDCDWLLESALPILNGETLHTDAKALLRHCIESLPRGRPNFSGRANAGKNLAGNQTLRKGHPHNGVIAISAQGGMGG
jgi:hypothetical protein